MTRTEKLWFGFFPQWILANGIGWFAYSFVFASHFLYVGFYIGVGLFIGFLQWLVLKRHLGVDTMWIWASTLTYGAFIFLIGIVSKNSYASLFFTSLIALFVVGFLQRSVLDYHLDYSILWLIVSASAGAIGLVVVFTIYNLFFPVKSPSIYWTLYGVFYGIATGVTLILLFAKTFEKPPF